MTNIRVANSVSAVQRVVARYIAAAKPQTNKDEDLLRAMTGLSIFLQTCHAKGHLIAKTDPLDMPISARTRGRGYVLDKDASDWNPDDLIKQMGLTEKDLKTELPIPLNSNKRTSTLSEVIESLKDTYLGSIGYEFAHITNPEKVAFLTDHIQTTKPPTKEDKLEILDRISKAQVFEEWFGKRFPTTKRFGLDGCEGAVVALRAVIDNGDASNVVLGMAHRGRLNVLANVCQKPIENILREFKGFTGAGGVEYGNTGDVKYHLGVETDITLPSNKVCHHSLLCNPSHLETVSTVVLGRARAIQDRFISDKSMNRKDSQKEVLPVIIHGDSSLAGQGIVYEMMQMSRLESTTVGGAVHIVINNQIGFTTLNSENSSTRYCTDIAKAFEIPVIHVNCDDVEAVSLAAKLAVDYRNRFNEDVFIDLVGYRRNGHNELDMPSFTQPEMYKRIYSHSPVFDHYAKQLVSEGIVKETDIETMRKKIITHFDLMMKEISKPAKEEKDTSIWSKMNKPCTYSPPPITGLNKELMTSLLNEITTLPSSLTPHPSVAKIYASRRSMVKTGKGFDFGTCESLAFASLLTEGFNVRLVGQDSQRGTFSHRHAVVHDQITFDRYFPLKQLVKGADNIQIYNSLLSEYGALGYEVGYASNHPDTLTIWEAQFGDFVNGGQIMIDQYIASQEVKWGTQSGLVMMLPHGYDGLGPEHSSARVERFLTLCDNREDVINSVHFDPEQKRVIQTSNMQIIMPTTPSNLFHALRRQVLRGFRKPLIVFQSKRLLKFRGAQSTIDEMAEGTNFVTFYEDKEAVDNKIERLILCSGQVYYDIVNSRKQAGKDNIAIARVEQLCPLPYDRMLAELKRYPNIKSVVWAQEEHMNAGMWSYMNPRLQTLLRYAGLPITQPIYVGRDVCAAASVGDSKIHAAELAKLLDDAMNTKLKHHCETSWWKVSGDGKLTRGALNDKLEYMHELS